MEKAGRNINLDGGGTVKRSPYKGDLFSDFIDWSILSQEEKQQFGIPTAKIFASKYGLHESQLSRWRQRNDFHSIKMERWREKWSDDLPEVFHALLKRIKRYGTARDVRLWLEYIEGWHPGREAKNQAPTITFSNDDIRTLISCLPEKDQKTYYDTLTELIAKAQQYQQKTL